MSDGRRETAFADFSSPLRNKLLRNGDYYFISAVFIQSKYGTFIEMRRNLEIPPLDALQITRRPDRAVVDNCLAKA